MRSLTIAGAERIQDLPKNTLNIQRVLTYQIDTCSFNLTGDRPLEGEEVIITQDGVRFFAGMIVNVELAEAFVAGSQRLTAWKVDCDDYTPMLDRRLVVETYENMSASDIFLDIAALYCQDFTVSGVQPGAPIVEYIRFDYIYPSECFKQLCEYIGWHWQPDYHKDLQFFSTDTLVQPAPMALTSGGPFRKLKYKIDMQGLRNRVYVLGGTFLSDPQTFEYVADGKERIWVLPYEPHSPFVSVQESEPVAAGLESVDEEFGFAWMYSQKEKYIRCSNQTPTPIAGATVAFTYQYPMDVITMVENTASQQVLAAAQGGDGIYEHKIYDDSLATLQAAEAGGEGDLREHANPKVSGSFESFEINGYIDTTQDWQLKQEDDSYISYYFYGGDAFGQSFVTPDGMNNAIKIQAGLVSGGVYYFPIETHWYIRQDNDGEPGKSITKYHGVVASGDWPTTDGEWAYSDITLTEPLRSGEKYWLVVEGQGEFVSIQSMKYKTGYQMYENGYMVCNATGGGWDKYLDVDVAFRIKALVLSAVIIWQPGQLVSINLPDRGINGEYLVQAVKLKPVGNSWVYTVEYGGRLVGLPDLLRALVSAQQNKATVDVKYQTKFASGEDTIDVLDEAFITPRTQPWYAGDADAIAGEIIALAVV